MQLAEAAPYADNVALLDALRELGDSLIERALLRRQLDETASREGADRKSVV